MGNRLNDIVDYGEVDFYDLSDRGIYAEAVTVDPWFLNLYATDIVKCRWFEVEPIIMIDHESAWLYARDIIKGRWLEAEPCIKSNPVSAYIYAKNVIKVRWVEAEPIIMRNKFWWGEYCSYFGIDQR